MPIIALKAVRVLKAANAYAPFQVKWLLGRIHVATSDAEVRADIVKRARKLPAEVREALATYALAVHRSNQRLYRQVTSGRF